MKTHYNETTTIFLSAEALHDMPLHVAIQLEEWIERRCRARGTKIFSIKIPSRGCTYSGTIPEEVVDMFCAIRLGATKKIEQLALADYQAKDDEVWVSTRLKEIGNES